MSGWDAARFGWLLACTLVASVTDVRERRIPNWLVVVCAAATPVWVAAGVEMWRDAVVGGIVLGGLVFIPVLFGRAGMGDAKLVTALGLGIGLRAAASFTLGTGAAMLVAVGAVKLAAHRAPKWWWGAWPLAPSLVVGVAAVIITVR